MKGEDARLKLYPGVRKQVERLGRRWEVLEAMWAGKCTKEIAAELGLSPKTVEFHRGKLYDFFGVRNPVGLCRRALAMGLLAGKSGERELAKKWGQEHAKRTEGRRQRAEGNAETLKR
jgi:hypothetical protein